MRQRLTRRSQRGYQRTNNSLVVTGGGRNCSWQATALPFCAADVLKKARSDVSISQSSAACHSLFLSGSSRLGSRVNRQEKEWSKTEPVEVRPTSSSSGASVPSPLPSDPRCVASDSATTAAGRASTCVRGRKRVGPISREIDVPQIAHRLARHPVLVVGVVVGHPRVAAEERTEAELPLLGLHGLLQVREKAVALPQQLAQVPRRRGVGLLVGLARRRERR